MHSIITNWQKIGLFEVKIFWSNIVHYIDLFTDTNLKLKHKNRKKVDVRYSTSYTIDVGRSYRHKSCRRSNWRSTSIWCLYQRLTLIDFPLNNERFINLTSTTRSMTVHKHYKLALLLFKITNCKLLFKITKCKLIFR